jgi:L-galactose dehydrogenase/L-glyceraldehyde 3-phosphate reductase
MERRTLGKTGLSVSALGFGCGDVGGLIVRGTPADRERAVARALELGINYFDTAASYGRGESEKNLGQVLRALKPDIVLGTKFRIDPPDHGRIAEAVAASLEASLARLGRERVDLLQLHNRIAGDDRALDPAVVLDQVVPALERLQRQGKIGFFGITALGHTPAIHRVVDAGVFHTAQVCYNLLNPSAGGPVPPGHPAQDFGALLDHTRAAAMGVIGIRVLAAGALSGVESRHALAMPKVDPIATGPDYAADVARARRLEALVREGHARSLVEAAIRFAISSDAVSTALVGYSSLEQLDDAAAAANRGPLPRAALDRAAALLQETP